MSKAIDKSRRVEYPAFTIYPYYHGSERMIWSAATVVHMDKVESLIFTAALSGRDPKRDRQPQTWAEERQGVGVVVAGGIKEQTAAAWERIKETLEAVGARLENVIFRRRYLPHRWDWFDFLSTENQWWREHCLDLAETSRPGTALKHDLELDLPDMLIAVDVMAVTAKK